MNKRIFYPIILITLNFIIFYKVFFFGEVISTTDTLYKEYPWKGEHTSTELELKRYTQSDITAAFLPFKIFLSSEYKKQFYVKWTNLIGCGYPLVSHSTLYSIGIPSIFLRLFPFEFADKLSLFFQILIASIGMFYLMLYWIKDYNYSLFASIIFSMSYPLIEFLPFDYSVMIFIPVIVLFLEKYFDTRKLVYFSLSVLIIGYSFLNGSIQSYIYIFLLLSIYFWVKYRILLKNKNARFSISYFLINYFGILTLSVLMSFIFLLPNLELFLFHNVRERALIGNWASFLFVRPLVLSITFIAGTLYPGLLGNTNTIDFKSVLNMVFGDMGFSGIMAVDQFSAYIGLLPLIFSVFGFIIIRKHNELKLVFWIIVISFFAMMFTPLYLFTYMRGNALFAFSLSILSTFGLKYFIEEFDLDKYFKKIIVPVILITITVLVSSIFIKIFEKHLIDYATNKMYGKIESGTFTGLLYDISWQKSKVINFIHNYSIDSFNIIKFSLLLLSIVFITYLTRNKKVKSIVLIIIVIAISYLDLFEMSQRLIPFNNKETMFPATKLIDTLKSKEATYRVSSAFEEPPVFRQNQLMPYKIDDWMLYSSFKIPFPKPYFDVYNSSNIPKYANVKYFVTSPNYIGYLDTNLKKVYSGGDGNIYQYKYCLPRAFLVPLGNSNIDDKIIELEKMEPDKILSIPIEEAKVDYSIIDEAKINFNCRERSLLVLLDRNYPGWKAYKDNGDKSDVKTIFGIMRAVEISESDKEITFIFEPKTFYWGGIISGMSILVITFLPFLKCCRNKKSFKSV